MNNNPNKYKLFIMRSNARGAPFYFPYRKFVNTLFTKTFKKISKQKNLEHVPLLKLTGAMRHEISGLNVRFNTNNQYINYVLDNQY